ncbi:hypothetical protein PMAYCL1PPCAC_20387, partial [Pristionchus mayeri]
PMDISNSPLLEAPPPPPLIEYSESDERGTGEEDNTVDASLSFLPPPAKKLTVEVKKEKENIPSSLHSLPSRIPSLPSPLSFLPSTPRVEKASVFQKLMQRYDKIKRERKMSLHESIENEDSK